MRDTRVRTRLPVLYREQHEPPRRRAQEETGRFRLAQGVFLLVLGPERVCVGLHNGEHARRDRRFFR